MASSDDSNETSGEVVESATAAGSDRTPSDSVVVEIGPRAIPSHLSSTGSNGTKSSSLSAKVRSAIIDSGSSGRKRAPTIPPTKTSTALGFGPHRSPETKSSTEPGFGPHRSPARERVSEGASRTSDAFASANDNASDTSSTLGLEDAPRRDDASDSSSARDHISDTPRFTREALRTSTMSRMGSSVRRALRFAFRDPRSGMWSMLVVVCAMIIVGVSALAAKHVDAWTVRPGEGGSMVVYLGEGVDDATASKLVSELRGLAGVQHAELVAPDESAKRLQQALGGDASLMEGIDTGSLPASIEITLAPGVRDVVAMSPTVRALKGAPGVEDVVLDEASEDRTSAALGTVRTIVWTGAALLAGLALLIALATIRLRLDRDPDEQRVAHMLGAGPSFLMTPSIMAGMLLGALAALIAGIAIVCALHAYGDSIVTALAGPLGAIDLAMPSLCELAMFVGLGAMLGLVGGGLAGASRVAR